MATLVLVTRVFPPEGHPTAIMMSELATHLASKGWTVHVVTGFPNHPEGRIRPGYRRTFHRTDHHGAYTVHRTWHTLSRPGSLKGRALEIATRSLTGALQGLNLPRLDVIAVVGLPLLGALAWSPVARRHGAALVNIVYDLYPDIAIETNRLERGPVSRLARTIEQAHWRCATQHVVLSEGFRDILRSRGVPETRISVHPVWLDASSITPGPRDNAWRAEHGIDKGQFVALYAGTLGLVSGAQVIVRAADRLRARQDIVFLVVGEGAAKRAAMQEAKRLALNNIRFMSFQPRERLSEMQAAANVGLVTLAPGRGRTSVPSKVLGYMAAGRAVVAAVDRDSDTAREIERHECGVVVPADDDLALAATLERLADAPEECERLGTAARSRFESQYTAERVLERYSLLFQSLVGARQVGAPPEAPVCHH